MRDKWRFKPRQIRPESPDSFYYHKSLWKKVILRDHLKVTGKSYYCSCGAQRVAMDMDSVINPPTFLLSCITAINGWTQGTTPHSPIRCQVQPMFSLISNSPTTIRVNLPLSAMFVTNISQEKKSRTIFDYLYT